jgi:uncharacterized protein (TIGR00369 family)
MMLTAGDWLRKYVDKTLATDDQSRLTYPSSIAQTLGLELTEIAPGQATLEMRTDTARHANPMGTIHGGVLCDIADMAIGTAHATTLQADESFTTIDLRINFFRPIWNERIRAVARAVQRGKTVSYYTCDIHKADGKLIATVTSSLLTLRGSEATGR